MSNKTLPTNSLTSKEIAVEVVSDVILVAAVLAFVPTLIALGMWIRANRKGLPRAVPGFTLGMALSVVVQLSAWAVASADAEQYYAMRPFGVIGAVAYIVSLAAVIIASHKHPGTDTKVLILSSISVVLLLAACVLTEIGLLVWAPVA